MLVLLALRARLFLARLIAEQPGMEQEKPMDVASEPVDLTNDDAAYMDTGVLHQGRICSKCAKNPVVKGKSLCVECEKKK